jgi:hypothetical protein
MLGDVRLFHSKPSHQISSRKLPILQQLDDCDPRRMRKSLEDVGLKAAQ